MTCGSYSSYGSEYDYYGCGNHQSQYNCYRPCKTQPCKTQPCKTPSITIKITNFGKDEIRNLMITYVTAQCGNNTTTKLHYDGNLNHGKYWTVCIPCNVFSISGKVNNKTFIINKHRLAALPQGLYGNAVPFNNGTVGQISDEGAEVVYNSSYNCKCWDINLAAGTKE